MKLEVYKKDGAGSGEQVSLPKAVFEAPVNEHAVYLAVKAQMVNARQGNAASKTRSMVSGGGKKPWKQKGRGVARAGSSRSPLWVGGGRVFGPEPHDFSMRLPKRVKTRARVSVLSSKAKENKITVVEDFKIESGKTKEMHNMLKSLGLEGEKVLLLLSEHDPNVLRAGRNIPRLNIRVAATESTYDLLNCEKIVVQKSGLDKLVGALKS
jgi:large subunit ribosomal protein L4